MKIKSEKLINELIELTAQNIGKIEVLKNLPATELNWRANADSWSVLETVEHLNLYGNYYMPEFERCLNDNTSQTELYFKSGLLGNYFAESMLPKEQLNKMKTFKDKNPIGSQLDKGVILEFLKQENQLLKFLNTSRNLSLNKAKCAISISKWVKLKLGDTFRFVIYHHLRHLVQIDKCLEDFRRDAKGRGTKER